MKRLVLIVAVIGALLAVWTANQVQAAQADHVRAQRGPK